MYLNSDVGKTPGYVLRYDHVILNILHISPQII